MNDKEKLENNVKILQDHILILKDRYVEEIKFKDDIKSRAYIYIQLYLRRCVELIEGIIESSCNKRSLMVISSTRMLLESVARFNAFHNQLKEALESEKTKEAYEVINKFMLCTRDEELLKALPQNAATNIITHINKFVERNEKSQEQYEVLSGKVHPNYEGLFGLYGSLEEDGKIIFSPEEKVMQEILNTMVVAGKSLKSSMFIFNETLDLLNELEAKK